MSLNLMVNNLQYEFGWDYYTKLPLLNIVDVRNGESHRSPEELRKSEAVLEDSIKHMETKQRSSDEEKQLKKLKRDLKNLKAFHKWLGSTPYSEVTDSLAMLVNRIKSSILY